MKTRHWMAILCCGLGAASVAHGASGVTIYGQADVGPSHSSYRFDQAGSRVHKGTNGLRSGYLGKSRFGLKGKEDLGGGLSAVFQLEQRVDLRDGSTKDGFDRLAFVGLDSASWGTFTMGRQKDIADSFSSVETVKSLGKVKRTFGGKGGRRNGLFKYVTPSFSGLQAGLAYARNEDAGGNTDHFYSAGLLYKKGALRLSGVYDHDKVHANGYAVKNWLLAGAYDFKVTKLSLAYGQDRNGKLNKPGDVSSSTLGGFSPPGLGNYNQQGFKSHNYYLGLAVPTGPATVGLMWAHSSSNLHRIDSSFQAGSQNIYAAMYTYPLSRRTQLYAYGAWARNLAYVRGFKGREAGLGVNHKF